MPRKRWTLTRSQKTEYNTAVQRMRAAGADLAPFGFDCEWIRVTHCPIASCVRTWTGATVFVIHVRMVGLASKIVLQGFDLSSPEWEFNAYVLDDPALGNSAQQLYRMLDGSRFHRSEILNHRVDEEGLLRHGDVMEGLVLAECFSSVPTCYNRSNSIPLTLSMGNQFDELEAFSFALPVEHVSRQPRPRRSGSLFGPPGRAAKAPVPPGVDRLTRETAFQRAEVGSEE
jgi:hypothetical protein